MADSSFAALGLLGAVRHRLSVIIRLRLDAARYEPAPARAPTQVGRPRCKGARLPALKAVLADPATAWQSMTVSHWYGTGERQVEWISGTGGAAQRLRLRNKKTKGSIKAKAHVTKTSTSTIAVMAA